MNFLKHLQNIDDIIKKAEHEKYKKVYGKYASKLYSICKENCEKATGKREYDKNPAMYNQALNCRIHALNERISGIIEEKDYSGIYYNETKFDSLGDLSYGHDGLLAIFHLLFEKYPMLGKIISEKYDNLLSEELNTEEGQNYLLRYGRKGFY